MTGTGRSSLPGLAASPDDGAMNLTVQDVMTRAVVTVAPETPFKEVAELLEAYHISAVPVVDSEGLLGIVSEADLLDRRGETAADVMSHPVQTIRPSASVAEAARLMHRRRVKRLPVTNAGGELVGIVSRSDVVKSFLRSDLAIASEIREDVLRSTLAIDPDDVQVEVDEGVVTLKGRLETSSLVKIVGRLIEAVPGVVAVHDELTYRLDDHDLKVGPPEGSLHLSAQEREGT